MKTYRQTSRNAKEVTYADPEARYNTVTLRNSVQPKKAGSKTVYNSKSGINVQRTASLPAQEGCVDKCAPLNQEKLSGSVNLSGSTESYSEVLLIWEDLKVLGDKLVADMAKGFLTSAESVDLAAA